MSLPSAIFFINGDITLPSTNSVVFPGTDPKVSELTTLQTQLFIDDTMTKNEFDARVAVDPNYPTIIHLQNLRILVIVPAYNDGYTYMNLPNMEYADVVMFLHQGLADVEFNRFGPPCQNYEIQRLTIYELLRAVHSPNVVILQPGIGGGCCDSCNYPFFCDRCHSFSGIRLCGGCGSGCKCGCDCNLIDNQGRVVSPIHLPNCDNIYHNKAFINRK